MAQNPGVIKVCRMLNPLELYGHSLMLSYKDKVRALRKISISSPKWER